MDYVCIHEKEPIRRHLEIDPYLHLYGLGDLDDFFWPRTTWYGLPARGPAPRPADDFAAVLLVYAGPDLPTVLGLTRETPAMSELLGAVSHLLPARFFAHFSPGVERALPPSFRVEFAAPHLKMKLDDPSAVRAVAGAKEGTDGDPRETHRGNGSIVVETLDATHLPELERLYRESYPDNWFDSRMLETGVYRGIRIDGRFVSVAGIHVYSPICRVAALGNIVTHPGYRGRGLATRATAAVCETLIGSGMRIGLNVVEDNDAAISVYRRLGFEVAARYGEFMIQYAGRTR